MSRHATIASNVPADADPEVGQEIEITNKAGVTHYKRRVLVGWNHQTDNPNALMSGKIWGWTSKHDHFHVYDEDYNRSKNPGEVRFCGVANFTMIR